jgi:cytoskeletal protein RodZ
MDDEHFGNCLRRAREEKSLTVGDVSASTKVPRSAIELLESGSLSGLPAHVFVRGFIRSYAKAVGLAEAQPLGLFDRAVNRESEAARAKSASPVVDPVLAGGPVEEAEDAGRRRGLGLAVFVIILVLIATITLSLLLRRPPPSGEGLSLRGPTPTPAQLVGALGADTPAGAPLSSDTAPRAPDPAA